MAIQIQKGIIYELNLIAVILVYHFKAGPWQEGRHSDWPGFIHI
jgi:hypothetical protein